ncbi:MAG: hypothetical protein U0414_08340 [Polyangiaceae bacterium]
MSPLERRLRALLALYPEAFRERWGEELVLTSLEAAKPGQSWPTIREAADLTLAALRAHARTPLEASFPRVLRQGAILGVALLVILRAILVARGVCGAVRSLVLLVAAGAEVAFHAHYLLFLQLTEFALYGVLLSALVERRRWLGVVSAVALTANAALVTLAYDGPIEAGWLASFPLSAGPPLLLGAIALAASGETPPSARRLRWRTRGAVILGLLLAGAALAGVGSLVPVAIESPVEVCLAVLTLAGAALLRVFDARWLVGIAVALTGRAATENDAKALVVLLVLAAAAHWRAVKRARREVSPS